MNKKRTYGVNVGSSSILLIFVILCLVSFATLSIVSSNADYKLTSKVLERTRSYYDACNEAEASIAGVDKTLREVYESAADEDTYFQTVGHSKSYAISISDIQSLDIAITLLYPDDSDGPFYQIDRWQVITTGDLEYDDTLPVFQ